MATTTGTHTLTYPNQSQATPWTSTFTSLAQGISDDLDNLGTTIIAQVNDSNSNELLVFSTTAAAVNHMQLANAATGNGPTLSSIGSDTNIDLNITPKGSGNLVLDGLSFPNADGTANQSIKTDASGNLSFTSTLNNIVEDTTPQLGGALDVNGNEIQSISSGDIDIHSDADILMELGDAAGADKISILDSGAVEVASINSDGDISCTDITANSLSVTSPVAGSDIDVNGITAETSPDDADEVLIYDASAGANRKMTVSNFLTGTGDWQFISSTSLSSQSSVDISLSGSYDVYKVVTYNISDASDNFNTYFRFRTTGGGVRTGASDYSRAGRWRSSSGGSNGFSSTNDELDVLFAGGNQASNSVVAQEYFIYLPHNANVCTLVQGYSTADKVGSITTNSEFCGRVETAEANDLIRIYTDSSAFDQGTVVLYGLS